jgi:hypothetical protein
MLSHFINVLVFLSRPQNVNRFDFDALKKRPRWGSGLSVAELNNLRLERGWAKIPDVRIEGIQFVTRIRGQIYKSHSATTMLTHLKMHMW